MKIPELVRKGQSPACEGFTLYEFSPVTEPEIEIRGPEVLRSGTLTIHYQGIRIELPTGFSTRDLVRIIRALKIASHD